MQANLILYCPAMVHVQKVCSAVTCLSFHWSSYPSEWPTIMREHWSSQVLGIKDIYPFNWDFVSHSKSFT